jgi:hypothetical protein
MPDITNTKASGSNAAPSGQKQNSRKRAPIVRPETYEEPRARQNFMGAMKIPETAYVGLYGSHSGDWRSVCARALDEHQILWYDPTDERWKSITRENGDSKQELIDSLVEVQHRGMLNADCVIYQLAHKRSYYGAANRPSQDNTGEIVQAFAARCELGFLIGKGIKTFAYIDSCVEGRNYLWAAMKPYQHIVRAETLENAIDLAIEYMLNSEAHKR